MVRTISSRTILGLVSEQSDSCFAVGDLAGGRTDTFSYRAADRGVMGWNNRGAVLAVLYYRYVLPDGIRGKTSSIFRVGVGS